MDLLYVLYTYNRVEVLQECLRTLFANNDVQPQRVVIIDDGSAKHVKESLFSAAMNNDGLVDLFSLKQNVGYGRAAEIGFAVADLFQPRYCFFIESDYVFRKHGLDEVMEVLRSDVGRFTAGIAGYSHPHFFDSRNTVDRYPQEMVSQRGYDNLNRAMLYRPFPYKSRFGDLQVQFVSNSCGTMYLNWQLISEMRKAFYPRMETEWIHATCGKGKERPLLNDGIMSQTLSHFWMEYARRQGWDTNRYGPLLDIMPSVANHLSGGGINAEGAPEGHTFVGSPSFPKRYDEYPQPPPGP